TRVMLWQEQELALTIGPSRLGCVAVGGVLVFLLYRRITTLGRLTLAFWLAVLGIIAWILIEGALRFDPATAFDFGGKAAAPENFATGNRSVGWNDRWRG